jgi:hypothetical protein
MSNISSLKAAARGRWPELLQTLGGISSEVLDGQHHPCPKCGGTDRFRLIDADAGALLCNQCFAKNNGDGISALQWAADIDFKAAVKLLADYLGVKTNGRTNGSNKAKKIGDSGAKKNGQSKLIATYDYVDVDGKQRYQVCRFELKDFRQRKQNQDGRWCWSLKGVERIPYRLNWVAHADLAKPIFVVEGEKDADRLLQSGAGIVATCNAGGAGKWDAAWSRYFVGRPIVILPDNDEPGRDHAHDVAIKLFDSATSIKVVTLPGLPVKGDVSVWLDAGHTTAELLALVDATPPVTAEQIDAWKRCESHNAMTEIVVGTDEPRVIDEAIGALATCENVFQRGGSLVHIVEGIEPPRGIARPKESPRIAPMRFPRIREHLAAAAAWWRPEDEGEREAIHPPDWVVKAIDARGQWPGIRRLEAVVESPVLRADGTVLQDTGYDAATGIVYRPQVAFPPIADRPTKADAHSAVQSLMEVVEDFPFAGDGHRAAWLAGLLTPLARYAFHGPSPLYLIDANVRGSGKSLLSDSTSLIVAGRPMARMSLPRDDDETRKRITALAIAGEPLILIDNLPPGGFGSPSLDAALTATSWSDRILGQTAMASGVPLYSTWYATGNNVILAGDTARRVVHIRLESPSENPEERAGFHHCDLLAWVRQERPRLTAAAVTILAAYCAAGRPDMGLTPWGSFEAWSGLVRQAVVWTGQADPGSTRTELVSQSDREAVALRQLIAGWEELDQSHAGMTVGEVLHQLADNPHDYDALRFALTELAPPRDGRTINARSVGMRLHHLRRRVVGGKYLDQRSHKNTAVWFVGGTGGTGGTSLDSARVGARAHAHAHAHENLQTPDISPTTPTTPTCVQVGCNHANVAETPTRDGYINRQCRDCGENLGCRKQ